MITNNFFDPKEAYPEGTNKEKQRAHIAELISKEICQIPHSRLITLLGQSLKWQQNQGLLPPGRHINIFEGKTAIDQLDQDMYPNQIMLSMEVFFYCIFRGTIELLNSKKNLGYWSIYKFFNVCKNTNIKI